MPTKHEIIVVARKDRRFNIARPEYVRGKTQELLKAGYSTVTEHQVDQQLTAIFQGGQLYKGLNVIGDLMKREIVLPK